VVGCGAVGGELAQGLVRSGVGHVLCCDHASVSPAHLYNQHYVAEDLYQKKALRLAHNLKLEAPSPLLLTGLAMGFHEARTTSHIRAVSLVVCAVDNDSARVEVARWCLEQARPAVFCATDATAEGGFVFVQTARPNEPCFGCLFPEALRASASAQRSGGSIEAAKAVAGMALYAALALALPRRPWGWRYRSLSLSGSAPDETRAVAQRPDCPLCRNVPEARIVLD